MIDEVKSMFARAKSQIQGNSYTRTLLNVNHVAGDEAMQALLVRENINAELSYIDTDPEGKANSVMVLLHGNSSSNKVFVDHIQKYSNNFRIIAVDLMGHGESSKISKIANVSPADRDSICAAFYSYDAMVHQIKFLLETLNVKNAHFIGWSLGGHLSYGIAMLDNDLVLSISSIGSPPVRFSHAGLMRGFSDWFVNVLVAEWVNHPKAYTHEDAKAIGLHIGFNDEDLAIFSKDMSESDPEFRKYLFLNLALYDSEEYSETFFDAESFIRQTNIPVNLIVGQNDVGISASYIAEMAKLMKNPSSVAHIIENASHAAFKTHADAYYQIINNFISSATKLQKTNFNNGLG